MQIGMIGLGKMGGYMVQRLRQDDHDVVAYDLSADAVKEAESHGASGASSLEEFVKALDAPRTAWVMVPHGDPTRETLRQLRDLMDEGDLAIDGGNSPYEEDKEHGQMMAEQGVHFMDIGVSGGVWGLEVGYNMMVGGDPDDVARVKPALDTLAPPEGWLHCGPVGAGHFVKMVHNGIEYGLMQAYGEGFEVLRESEYDLDLGAIAHLWNQGSVIRSWLCELAASAFKKDPDLAKQSGWVDDSGEGRWTVMASISESVPTPVITLSLQMRMRSRQDASYSAKVAEALREEFGGHHIGEAGTLS